MATPLADTTAASITAPFPPRAPKKGISSSCKLRECRCKSGPRPRRSWTRGNATSPRACPLRRSWSPGPRARASRTSTARPTSTSPAGSAARTPATACPRWSPPSMSRQTATSTSASWSGCTSRTWRCRRCGLSRVAASSETSRTRAGPSRTPSRSRVATDDPDRSSTAPSTAALLTMTMTVGRPLQRGFGPFAPGSARRRLSYRGVTEDAIHELETLFNADDRPQSVACVVLSRCRASGFVDMPLDFPPGCRSSASGTILYGATRCRRVGRTGPVWAIELRSRARLLVSGKSLGGGLCWRRLGAETVDAVPPAASAAPSAGTRSPAPGGWPFWTGLGGDFRRRADGSVS